MQPSSSPSFNTRMRPSSQSVSFSPTPVDNTPSLSLQPNMGQSNNTSSSHLLAHKIEDSLDHFLKNSRSQSRSTPSEHTLSTPLSQPSTLLSNPFPYGQSSAHSSSRLGSSSSSSSEALIRDLDEDARSISPPTQSPIDPVIAASIFGRGSLAGRKLYNLYAKKNEDQKQKERANDLYIKIKSNAQSRAHAHSLLGLGPLVNPSPHEIHEHHLREEIQSKIKPKYSAPKLKKIDPVYKDSIDSASSEQIFQRKLKVLVLIIVSVFFLSIFLYDN
jgi:hypothetical protein